VSKQSAFHPRLAALTDQWMDLFGYWAPSVVTDALEEYRAVRETAGLMDFSMLRKTDIDGERAVELVNSVVTRDVSKLRPGRIAYGALCDENGKMLDDCTVMLRDAGHVRFCGANDRDAEIFADKGKALGAEVREFTDEMPHLCVQGPASRDILAPLASKDISGDVFPYYTFREDVEVGGIPVFMTRMGYTAPSRRRCDVRFDLAGGWATARRGGQQPVGGVHVGVQRPVIGPRVERARGQVVGRPQRSGWWRRRAHP
jgi:aminomethyltransferase